MGASNSLACRPSWRFIESNWPIRSAQHSFNWALCALRHRCELILQIPFANSCLVLRGGLSFNAIEEVAAPICSMEGTVFSQRCFGLIGRAARFTGLQGLC
jgi:hypothetical protein